jgi:hypothetical protein
MPPKDSKKSTRKPHNFGRSLPPLVKKAPQQVLDQVPEPASFAPGAPGPPFDPSFGNCYPPSDIPQTSFNTATSGRIYNPWPRQRPTFGQGQGYDQGPAYRQTYAQANNSTYQANNGTQQGFIMPSSSTGQFPTNAPVAGPSYDNSGAQPAPPGYNSQNTPDTPRLSGSFYEYTRMYTQPYLPSWMYSDATSNGQIPAAPTAQNNQQYQVPAPAPDPAISQYPGLFSNRVNQQQRSLNDATGSWGYNDPLHAPTPRRPFMPDRPFGQYLPSQAPEPATPYAPSLDAHSHKRRRVTAECIPGNRADHEEAERMQRQEKQARVQSRQYAIQAQYTAGYVRALVQHAAITVEAEQEQRFKEDAYEEPPAAYRRVWNVTEEEQEEGDKAEEQGQYLDQREQSPGHNHDSGYHEQEVQGQEGVSQEKAEPEPTCQDNHEAPHDDEATKDSVDWAAWLQDPPWECK